LPRVALRHDEAQRPPVLGGEVLAILAPGDQHVVVVHRLQREVGRVAVRAVRDHPLRLAGGSGHLPQRAERHTLPGVVELGPSGHAVHVRVDGHGGQRLELLVAERDRLLDEPGKLEVPVRAVERRDRSVVEHRPGLDEPLAGRHALGDLGRVLLLEQAHDASFAASAAMDRHASIAMPIPSSSTSTWVTIRTPPGTGTAPTPAAASRSSTSPARNPTASVSTNTMFVTTRSRAIAPGSRSLTASPSSLARAWSSPSRSLPVSSASRPAAAMIPA